MPDLLASRKMQNLFKRCKSTTLPPIGTVHHASGDTNATKWQSNLFRDDHKEDYGRLMEVIHRRVYDEHGSQIANAENELSHALGSVLEDVAREREEIKQHFLQQVENIEREHFSREKACYDAAIERVMANSGSLPTPAQPDNMQPETISSVLTRYSDPFRAQCPYELLKPNVFIRSTDYESAPPPPAGVGSLPSDRDPFAGYPEAINHSGNNANISRSSLDPVQPVYPYFEAASTHAPGIRLVPKSSQPRSMNRSVASSHLTTPSIYSQELEWYHSQWPSPSPLRYMGQPVPGSPSSSLSTFTETIKQTKYTQDNQVVPSQGPPIPGYVLTQSVNGSCSPLHSNPPCDEFGRLSSASA